MGQAQFSKIAQKKQKFIKHVTAWLFKKTDASYAFTGKHMKTRRKVWDAQLGYSILTKLNQIDGRKRRLC